MVQFLNIDMKIKSFSNMVVMIIVVCYATNANVNTHKTHAMNGNLFNN